MAAPKKTYAPYEGQAYSVALAGGKTVLLDAGESYETSDLDEQRELDALAARADSGIKEVRESKRSRGGDDS